MSLDSLHRLYAVQLKPSSQSTLCRPRSFTWQIGPVCFSHFAEMILRQSLQDPPRLVYLQAVIFFPPAIVGLFGNPSFPASIGVALPFATATSICGITLTICTGVSRPALSHLALLFLQSPLTRIGRKKPGNSTCWLPLLIVLETTASVSFDRRALYPIAQNAASQGGRLYCVAQDAHNRP